MRKYTPIKDNKPRSGNNPRSGNKHMCENKGSAPTRMAKLMTLMLVLVFLWGCGSSGRAGQTPSVSGDTALVAVESVASGASPFDPDSAYAYLERQVQFGPRVPNSLAHAATAAWLASELKRHGAVVAEQRADLRAFDGTTLHAVNIMGSFNPDKGDRTLLLAHYDTRPWADEDADAANRTKPIDGANDGASGVAVLLEIARLLGETGSGAPVDILFVDCEDYGSEGDEESWALGARYFAENPIRPGYKPARAILLDMVGGKDAVFPAEYFSRRSAPGLDDAVRAAAESLGHGHRFPRVMGSAVTDDHVELIKAGIPAIDIIDYREGQGFAPTWHTLDDNLSNIDRATLRAVGQTVWQVLAH